MVPDGDGAICVRRAPGGEHLVIWYSGVKPDPNIPVDPSLRQLPSPGSVYEFEYRCRMNSCLQLVAEMRAIQAKLAEEPPGRTGTKVESVSQRSDEPQKWIAWYGVGAIEVDLEARNVRVILGYALLRGTNGRYRPLTPEQQKAVEALTKEEEARKKGSQ